MRNVRAIIVDDERPAREEMKELVQHYPELELVGEAANAVEASLDIKMPEESGFDLLESLAEVPVVIFTTAFDHYAVQAFEINALDYLMKPIREERFARAMEKVKMEFGKKDPGDKRIFFRDGDKCYFLQLQEIDLIESADNYSRLHFRGKKALIKRSLRYWEDILDDQLFFRISRTEIINTTNIDQILPAGRGKLRVRLKTGEVLDISNRQSSRFRTQNGI